MENQPSSQTTEQLAPYSRGFLLGLYQRMALIREFEPSRYVDPLKLRRLDEVGRLALVACRLAADAWYGRVSVLEYFRGLPASC